MKKVFLIILLMLPICNKLLAQTGNSYQAYLCYILDKSDQNPVKRAPRVSYVITVTGNEIELPYNDNGYVMSLYKDNEKVYSIVIPADVTLVTLPESFSGEFTLVLESEDCTLQGTIEL